MLSKGVQLQIWYVCILLFPVNIILFHNNNLMVRKYYPCPTSMLSLNSQKLMQASKDFDINQREWIMKNYHTYILIYTYISKYYKVESVLMGTECLSIRFPGSLYPVICGV